MLMELSKELVTKLVKVTNDAPKEKIESTLNGTVKIYGGKHM